MKYGIIMGMRSQVRVRLKNPLLPVLVVILLVLKLVDPFDGWTVLLVALGGAWIISWLWSRSLARNLRLRRETRFGWAQVGDRLEERFTLVNQGLFPALWVEVNDHTTMPGYRASSATGVGGFSETNWLNQGSCNQRGQFRHGPTDLLTGDPFGVYAVEIHDAHAEEFLVLPPVLPVDDLAIFPGGWFREGRPRSNVLEQSVSTGGVRPYQPGDAFYRIHWRTTARLDSPYVFQFDGVSEGDWWLVLDLDVTTISTPEQLELLEHSIILAASLAYQGIKSGRAVGLSINDAHPTWSVPRQGEGQHWDVMRKLAMAEPGSRDISLFLTGLPASASKGTTLILITANTDPSWLKTLLPLMWAGTSPMVLLIDPQSYGVQGDVLRCQQSLDRTGIRHILIPRQLFDRPETRPGKRGIRQWRVTPSGRAVQIDPLPDQEWKVFS